MDDHANTPYRSCWIERCARSKPERVASNDNGVAPSEGTIPVIQAPGAVDRLVGDQSLGPKAGRPRKPVGNILRDRSIKGLVAGGSGRGDGERVEQGLARHAERTGRLVEELRRQAVRDRVNFLRIAQPAKGREMRSGGKGGPEALRALDRPELGAFTRNGRPHQSVQAELANAVGRDLPAITALPVAIACLAVPVPALFAADLRSVGLRLLVAPIAPPAWECLRSNLVAPFPYGPVAGSRIRA